MYKQTCFHVVREQLIQEQTTLISPKKRKALLHVHVDMHPVENYGIINTI